jgi:hypothetical protein
MLTDSTGQQLAKNSIPVTLASDQPNTGGARRVTGTFANPSSAGAYAAGDIIANSATAGLVVPIIFTMPRSAGRLTGCRCVVTPASGSLVIAALDFDLLLFRSNTSIPFAAAGYPADNAALNVSAAAFREMVGIFRFVNTAWRNPAGGVTAGITGYQATGPASTRLSEPFDLSGLAATTILGVVQAQGIWTPGAVINTFDFALDVSLD